jgi:hypothetical protein
MRSGFVLVLWVASLVAELGCGGATSDSLSNAQPVTDAGTDGATATISPVTLGNMLGPDAGLSFGVTPAVADGCDMLCAKEATANCPNQGTTSSCAVGCRLLLNNPNCASASMALFACEGTSTVSCDSSGKATLDNCGVQTLSSAACFLTNAMDPTLQAPCMTYCAKVAAAACPNDTSGCQQGCQLFGGFIPACGPLWKTYVTCADDAAVTCGTDGKAGAPSCGVQGLVFLACLASGASTTTDAGP